MSAAWEALGRNGQGLLLQGGLETVLVAVAVSAVAVLGLGLAVLAVALVAQLALPRRSTATSSA